MRCFFIATLPLLLSIQLLAQKNKSKEDDWDKTFAKVELEAHTDVRAWLTYLKKATVLPDTTTIPPGTYIVKVKFIVDSNGNISDVYAVSNPGYGLARKAEKIIGNYEGVWIPANQCGRNVKSYKEQVVGFTVKQ